MRHIVGVADMRLSSCPEDTLVTHALGSCLGIVVYDAVACVGGMLHVMLPDSSIAREGTLDNAARFVDTGVPRLFRESYSLGAKKGRLVVKVAGGATLHGEGDDYFQIGKRNIVMLRRILWKNGVLITASDVGGCLSRTMSLDLGSGNVEIRSNGDSWQL